MNIVVLKNIRNELKAAAQAVPQVETDERLPRIGWRNGAKQAKMPGFFYIKADDLPDAPPDWALTSIYGDELGYQLPTLHLAYLGHRSQPFRREQIEGQKYPTSIWLARWCGTSIRPLFGRSRAWRARRCRGAAD